MYPDQFPEKNKTLQPPPGMADCEPLQVWCDGRMCVSAWRMSWRERIAALVFGRVWLRVYYGATQPPVSLEATRTIFINPPPSWLVRLRGWASLHHLGKRSEDSAAR